MKMLTLVVHDSGGDGNLQRQWAAWRALPAALWEQLDVVLVSGHDEPPPVLPPVRCLFTAADIALHIGACRNLGALHASTPWLLFHDSSQLLPQDALHALLGALDSLDAGKLYRFAPPDSHTLDEHLGPTLVAREAFMRMGGYDEHFSGFFGWENAYLQRRWLQSGAGVVQLQGVDWTGLVQPPTLLEADGHRNQAQMAARLQAPRKTTYIPPLSFYWKLVAPVNTALAAAPAPTPASNPTSASAPTPPAAARAAEPPTALAHTPGGTRLVIYTALVGAKEALGNPLAGLAPDASSDLALDFVCFTDNRSLQSPVWRFVYLDPSHLPPERLSRRPKALPHEYFPDDPFSLYIDNTVSLKRLPTSADLAHAQRPYLLRLFRATRRENLSQEADVIATLGYEASDELCTQLDFYARFRSIASITPFSTCTVLLREHNHPQVARLGVAWWEHILGFSKRDQMSFDYAVKQTGAQIHYFDAQIGDNDWLHWHANLGSKRLQASFDPQRYAWTHRHDPLARANPKQHYLERGAAEGNRYARPPDVFNYICHKTESSLGRQISPRRDASTVIGEALEPLREASGATLVMACLDSQRRDDNAFQHAEFIPAAKALQLLLPKFATQTTAIDPSEVLQSATPLTKLDGAYDLLLMLGVWPDQLARLVAKFMGTCNRRRGQIMALLNAHGDLAEAVAAQQAMSQWLGQPCRVAASATRHDGHEGPLNNGLVIYSWGD
jgi:hypothetical protein